MGVLAGVNLIFSIFMLLVDNWLLWKVEVFHIISSLALFFNFIYLVDMIMNFAVLGPKNIWKNKASLYLKLIA